MDCMNILSQKFPEIYEKIINFHCQITKEIKGKTFTEVIGRGKKVFHVLVEKNLEEYPIEFEADGGDDQNKPNCIVYAMVEKRVLAHLDEIDDCEELTEEQKDYIKILLFIWFILYIGQSCNYRVSAFEIR